MTKINLFIDKTKFSNIFSRRADGFTIVELLVVIVVIGILAAITVVSYSGITQKATIASLQTDLINSSKKLKMYYVVYGSYPTALGPDKCPTAPNVDANYCLKASSTHSFTHYSATTNSFTLTETSANNIKYTISENSSPQVAVSLAVSDPTNWMLIGTQVWAKYSLNVGTMVPGTLGGSNATNQTDNATVEKYCYQNNSANCTTYGGLYQWDEAMQYVTAEGAQGICPAGSHIPSDNEWKILEVQLGMTQAQADGTNYRGTDQGTQLRPSGSSGLNLPYAGDRLSDGTFFNQASYAYSWSSSEGGAADNWIRRVDSGFATVYRNVFDKAAGLSVRCMGN